MLGFGYLFEEEIMRILLLNPEYPVTFWGFQYSLPFIGRKCGMPSLPLLTLAGMFPADVHVRIVDQNVDTLRQSDLLWADAVFVTSMAIQRNFLLETLKRVKVAGKTVVLGGPYATSYHTQLQAQEIPVDHYVVGEMEQSFGEFWRLFVSGVAPKVFECSKEPEIELSPLPRFDLMKLSDYANIPIQFSRGCPEKCDFCEIPGLNGHRPRTKHPSQVIRELDYLHALGWKGSVFFVDDNFIGNVKKVREFLPYLIGWQQRHGYPFRFFTEASVFLAKHPDIMKMMVGAGFYMVFLGIETPSPQALLTMGKFKNFNPEKEPAFLLREVEKIQVHLEVMAGFIAGVDDDGSDSFDAIIDFVQKAGIPQAMTGLLTVHRNSPLFDRFEREGRILEDSDGDNVGRKLNFIPQLPVETLLAGYGKILESVHGDNLRPYYDRCLTYYSRSSARPKYCAALTGTGLREVKAFLHSAWALRGKPYARFLWQVLRQYPDRFPDAVRHAALGHHFELVAAGIRNDL